MGFLKRILRNGVTEDAVQSVSDGSFETLSDEELQTHMGIQSYGMFDPVSYTHLTLPMILLV